MVYSGQPIPDSVTVLFQFPLRATDDPLVWEYRPSLYGSVEATYSLSFRKAPMGEVRSVVGKVSRFRGDLFRRKDSIPGVVIMVDCEVP